MSFLPEVYQRNRTPLFEGSGIKLFRLSDSRKNKTLNEFLIREGWGPEDILQDMREDKSVKRLIKDIKKLMYDGVPLGDIADNIEYLESKASTRLTIEERTVLLKWLEKKEKKFSGPKRGLAAYNRRSNKRWSAEEEEESSEYTSKQIRSLRDEYGRIEKIDPNEPTYKALIKHLDSLPHELLAQLANAKIKWVSTLARNRVDRK
ncbi:hypothetical protein LCGC14_2958500 [marine sediment metagenome]|uniref:Uncharacterized protein n=1 Tax=marine sediment metagenome TaxID=412755 RepID=A0A0F8ZKQ8_9ZZZZ